MRSIRKAHPGDAPLALSSTPGPADPEWAREKGIFKYLGTVLMKDRPTFRAEGGALLRLPEERS
jgi:hypothetical protein